MTEPVDADLVPGRSDLRGERGKALHLLADEVERRLHAGTVELGEHRGGSLGVRAVVLLHDSDAYSAAASWRHTVMALPAVLETALATGEPLVTVSHST